MAVGVVGFRFDFLYDNLGQRIVDPILCDTTMCEIRTSVRTLRGGKETKHEMDITGIKNRQEHQDEWRDVKIHPIGFLSTTKFPLGHHINIIIIIFSFFWRKLFSELYRFK